jgi:hypothetical protein
MLISEAGIAIALGGFVGIAELLARYRTDPKQLLRTGAVWLYTALNAFTALAGLVLVHAFGWTFGTTSQTQLRVVQVLVASFGSVAFFRTSLFTARIAGNDVGIGPYTMLMGLLGTVDRAVDRVQASYRSEAATTIMSGVSFDKAQRILPTYCLALMQNVSSQDQETLAFQVKQLDADTSMSDDFKALALGLALMNLVGVDVLKAAVNALGDKIYTDVPNSLSASDDEKERRADYVPSGQTELAG